MSSIHLFKGFVVIPEVDVIRDYGLILQVEARYSPAGSFLPRSGSLRGRPWA